MDRIMPILIIAIIFLVIVILKFNPRISKVEDDSVTSYILHYTIRGNFGDIIRGYFILFKIHKL